MSRMYRGKEIFKPLNTGWIDEIEEMEENLILPTFRKLKFVDCNKPFWRKLMYRAFVRAKSGCGKWHDYEMSVAPYKNGKPIYYEFTSCPAAEFAIRHGLTFYENMR